MNRQEVYKVIDGERDYQDAKWGAAHDEGESVAGFLIYMDVYLQCAKSAATNSTGDTAALDMIRKVTALGVACGERFGLPERTV